MKQQIGVKNLYKTATIEINTAMWEKYQKTKSLAIRNHILSEYLYVVTVNAKRMSALYRNRADLEDIVNQGVIALINCIERYDWTKGVRFDSFASIRVRGAIIDYIRKQDWVPRSMRKKSINIERAYAELQGTLGRPPSDAEVAGSLSMSVKELSDVVAQSCNFAVLSFEELLQDGVPSFREPPSPIRTPEEELQEEEIKDILAMSIDSLGDKERLIVSLYYYEELKLKEIAVALGLTPSRVSQLHARALMKIKKMVGEYINN